ncbi:hypothetical protein ACLOJK_023987 [Asimina triloba]
MVEDDFAMDGMDAGSALIRRFLKMDRWGSCDLELMSSDPAVRGGEAGRPGRSDVMLSAISCCHRPDPSAEIETAVADRFGDGSPDEQGLGTGMGLPIQVSHWILDLCCRSAIRWETLDGGDCWPLDLGWVRSLLRLDTDGC